MRGVTLIDHALIKHNLTLIRDRSTSHEHFRRLLYDTTLVMACEITRDLPLKEVFVETPVDVARGLVISPNDIVIVAILRAGLGMLEPFLDILPGARAGHLGIFRDEQSLTPVQYYTKLPDGLERSKVIIVDPMLATGGSLVAACSALKQRGASDISACCIIAAPEGIGHMQTEHPDVSIYACAIDERLNANGYIVPGLGDAGDRQFGTHLINHSREALDGRTH